MTTLKYYVLEVLKVIYNSLNDAPHEFRVIFSNLQNVIFKKYFFF